MVGGMKTLVHTLGQLVSTITAADHPISPLVNPSTLVLLGHLVKAISAAATGHGMLLEGGTLGCSRHGLA